MSQKQLWAPWRMEYLGDPKMEKRGCVFCVLPEEKEDRKNLIVHRGQHNFVILNRYPYNSGHVMVVPFQHTANYAELPIATITEMGELAQHCTRGLREVYNAQGFNLGMNLGEAAGAGIREHLHLHVVPRWNGDTNFMPVLADTKSIPQHLTATCDDLTKYFGRL